MCKIVGPNTTYLGRLLRIVDKTLFNFISFRLVTLTWSSVKVVLQTKPIYGAVSWSDFDFLSVATIVPFSKDYLDVDTGGLFYKNHENK